MPVPSKGREDTEPERSPQPAKEMGEAADNRTSTAGVLDKLFGKSFLQAGRYIMSHKSWMKTVPTENCDVLMTFPDTTDDHTLLWLLNHIRLGIPELIIQIRHHKHTNVYAFFMTATYQNLLRGAEETGLRKPVKEEFGGGSRAFSCDEDYIYENIENEIYFFTSQERQSIIRYWLENLRAKQGESLHNIHFLEGQPIIAELLTRGIIQQVLPIHEQRILNRLVKSWVQAVCESQPVDEICEYFGVKIAMYFSWLGYYTWCMIYPAVLGFGLWTFTESDQTSRDVICVAFALFNVVWTTLFLEGWKRQSAELAYRWGTLDRPAELIEEPRTQFRGVKCVSPVTGCEDFYYPPWKRRLFQYFVSLPVCLFCLCVVFLTMLICFELQEFVSSIKELPRIVTYFPKVFLAVVITIFDDVYKKIAYWLNDMENYRLQSAYEKHLIIKLVLFQFVNSYLSLFYIGFYLKDMERLKEMLAALLITRQIILNVKEVLQPLFYEKYKQGHLTLQVTVRMLSNLFRYTPRQVSESARAPGEDSAEQADANWGDGHQEQERKCENGACGAPEEEEQQNEEEGDKDSVLDCGLRLSKKVSFAGSGQKGVKEERNYEMEGLIQGMLMEEGSPILVERGAEGGLVFELCEHDMKIETDDGDGGEDGKELSVMLRHRRKEKNTEQGENSEPPSNRLSWMDPPDDYDDAPLTQGEIESCMQKYEVLPSFSQDTFQDYQEMFIQFGYVVLFSSAFPLAAMCALINNVIEIRSDAFKLCTGSQRPFGQRVDSIGQWQNVMEAMGVLAIIVNCYLIGQCGQLQRLFPSLSPEMAIILVVVLEHFAFLLKYVLQIAIPDVPAWVAEEMAKLEYQRREAFKKHERQAQQHYQQQQKRRQREEEEKHRQEHKENVQSRKDREAGKEEAKSSSSSSEQAHSRAHSKSKAAPSCLTAEKPKRPSSLLASNNVLKLKQIIPLQGKFLSGSGAGNTVPGKTPQSPTGSESKLPGFLSFKFLKSPADGKKEGAAEREKVQSPTKPFNPGKLFNFGKSDPAGSGGNGASTVTTSQPKTGAAVSSSEGSEKAASKSDLNGLPEAANPEDPSSSHPSEESSSPKH
ncbi:anoctamin-8 isoform X3 [Chiloscyllium plagiosum]|uniref:anoctamin-8 isoform X3 n=1 Tax=Chiloscyllium plagiosum TaxID=36176 RepID=UPI001CB7D8DF|nr:anoctamin-8 isoform X3 [Chiloscyllium plagiosum]